VPLVLAGHGVQANDQNYLIPVEEVETDALLDYKALRVQTVLSAVKAAGCNLGLILLDACRSKPSAMRGETRDISRGLAKIDAPVGTVVAFACDVGCTASDGSGRNGVFTSSLLKHLGTPGVDVDFMLGDVASNVAAMTNGSQVPFRNHNLQGKRPCCLITADPAASTSTMTQVQSTSDLAAFMARCDLDDEDSTIVDTFFRRLKVKKEADLMELNEDDLNSLELALVPARKLRRELAALKASQGQAANSYPGSAPVSPSASPTPAPAASDVFSAIEKAKAESDYAAIVSIMRSSSGEETVEVECCKALYMVACEKTQDQFASAGVIEMLIAAMRSCKNSEGVQLYGSLALGAGTANNDTNKTRAGSAGVVEVVLDALKLHASNAHVQEEACTVLSNVCSVDAIRTQAGAVGAINAIATSVRNHSDSEGVQLYGLKALLRLTQDHNTHKAMAGEAGVIELTLAALKTHFSSAELQRIACNLIGNLSSVDALKLKAGAAGAIEAVAASLRRHADSEDLQLVGCVALARLTADCMAHKTKAGEEGVIELAVAALKAYAANEDIQDEACSLLANVCAVDANQVKAGSAGAIEAVSASMRRHADHTGVQLMGCVALSRIAADNDLNKSRAEGAGVIDVAVAALGRHFSDAQIQEEACTLISTVCSLDSSKAKASAIGAIEAILASMRRHTEHAGVQQFGFKALFRICPRNDARESKLRAGGGMDLIFDALKSRSTKPQVLTQACTLLACVCDDTTKNAAAKTGVFDALAECMRRNSADEDVQHAGSLALGFLTSNHDSNKTLAGAVGIIEIALAALKAHASSAKVQEEACTVLGNLCSVGANQTKASSLGAIEQVVAALRRHADTSGVQQYGFKAMGRLTSNNEANKAKAGSAGIIELAIAALRAHPNNAEVQEGVCTVLANVCSVGANQVKAVAVGALEALAAAMRRHINHAGLQGFICIALSRIVVNMDTHKTKAADAGVIEVAVAVLKAHPTVAQIQEDGCVLLSYLCSLEANQKKAANSGAIEAIIAALKAHPSNEGVHTFACTALRNICWTVDGHRRKARDAGALVVLKAAQARFPTGRAADAIKETLAKVQ
jgi:Caspase domain